MTLVPTMTAQASRFSAVQVRRQREPLLHLHEVDTPCLQHGAVGEIDLVHHQLVIEPLGHLRVRSRQEARTQAVRGFAQTQIETGGLDLVIQICRVRRDPALLDRLLDFAVGQNAVVIAHEGSNPCQ